MGSDVIVVARIWSKLRCGTIMVAKVRRNFCQYRWAPMWLWSQGLEGTSVSIRCFGKDWNRRESGEKASLGKVAGGCGRDCRGRLVFVGFCRHGMWNQQALERGVNIAEDETAVSAPSMLFAVFLVKLGSFGKGWRKYEVRRAEVRVREWRHSRYGEETSVGIRCEIRKLWKRSDKNMKLWA